MRDSVPSTRYSSVCNVLNQWRIWLIPTYRVYQLYDNISVWHNYPHSELVVKRGSPSCRGYSVQPSPLLLCFGQPMPPATRTQCAALHNMESHDSNILHAHCYTQYHHSFSPPSPYSLSTLSHSSHSPIHLLYVVSKASVFAGL